MEISLCVFDCATAHATHQRRCRGLGRRWFFDPNSHHRQQEKSSLHPGVHRLGNVLIAVVLSLLFVNFVDYQRREPCYPGNTVWMSGNAEESVCPNQSSLRLLCGPP